MKKFLLHISIFGIIFLLNGLFIFVIDPYNLFFDSNFIEDDIKQKSLRRSDEVMPRGCALWKLNEYAKHPNQNVIIGDSRTSGFDTDLIKEVAGESYYNIGIPGGNYNTIRDVFWYANDKAQLKNVVIQVGFHTYNKRINYDLINSIKKYLQNPFKTLFKNWFTFDSFKTLQLKISGTKSLIDEEEANLKLRMDNLANWEEIKQSQGYAFLSNYEYPDNFYNSLKEISEYCHHNNINLTFVIFPSHPDFYNIIDDLKISKYRERFVSDINELGKTFDYTSATKLTTNKLLYYDLYHLKHSVVDSLTYEIWNEF